ncbi:MAG: hypothetical protein GTO17_05205 [Candidatus Aminicenantes bacterium]|nr:hypothetical protein [Candidatus Aminicenantes bacterium]
MDEATFSGLALPSPLGGGTAPLPPFQRSPSPSHGSLPPLLGPCKASCDQGGHTPLDPPSVVSTQRCCTSREPDIVGHRVCLSPEGDELRRFREEQRGNGVKNLNGSKAIPKSLFLSRAWTRLSSREEGILQFDFSPAIC